MSPTQIQAFRDRVAYRQETRLRRLVRSPIRYAYSRGLQSVAERFHLACRREVTLFWGDRMTVVLPDQVSNAIHRYGFFEEDLTGTLLECLKPGMTFFDIGAHFGYFSLLASAIVGETGRVHSFEPTPSTFAMLQANTRSKRNVVANNIAAWSSAGTIPFRDYGLSFAAFNSVSGGKLDEATEKKLDVKQYNVKTLRIDDYVREQNVAPDFVKLDAEGAESEILQGMRQTLADHKPMISLEVADIRDDGHSSGDLVKFLMDLGYDAYQFENNRLVRHELQGRYGYANLLFRARPS